MIYKKNISKKNSVFQKKKNFEKNYEKIFFEKTKFFFEIFFYKSKFYNELKKDQMSKS